MRSELTYQIALTMAKGVGPVIARKLVAAMGGVEKVFSASIHELEHVQGIGKTLASQIKDESLLDKAEKEIDFLTRKGGFAVSYDQDEYSRRLKECEDYPMVLYGKGTMNVNARRVIGIVGTRKMTRYGRELVGNVLDEMAGRFPDCLVVSGLAHGVDGAAHRRAVELGMQTIGVVGHGLDMMYPAAHRALANDMMRNGGVVTEFYSHCLVDRKNFVSRNRIIAGMCDVVWVVESGEKGGALLTADFANSYNRDVCATPGRVSDPYSRGCNYLIKANKASLVETADDIIALMNWEEKSKKKKPIQLSLFMELSEKERLVVQLLEMEGQTQLNQLSRKLQIPVGEITSLLFEMEMKDLIVSYPGSVYGLRTM